MILNKLLELQHDEPGWIIKTCLEGPDNRLVGLFCVNPTQVQLLIKYHDVVILINNTKIRLVCQGLSADDETSSNCQWFFQCLRDATGDLAPQVLFSDSEPALINAVSIILPETKHFPCIFHIQQNIHKKLKQRLGSNYEDFLKNFYRTRNSLNEPDFERRWTRMIEKFPQAGQQVSESLFYRAIHLGLFGFKNIQSTNDVPDNNFIEDLNDQLRIPSSLEDSNHNDTEEIWQIKGIVIPVTHYIVLIKDATLLEEIFFKPFNFEYLRQMRVDNNTVNLETIYNIDKKIRYSTGFGILKKALNLTISLNCDDELLGILHRFIDEK
ncbi:protein FAR1-related sequence 4 isoform X1 [Rhizophagus clarus]|uniref:Protein FAR1-related sequence 4 isoform X1 n=1 Tax=Rhizophagus clarus TaxID=94130 RepID=A0A8H3QI39_9GLOM|nr:protein FAR1-related sequence 4 isoform X1 [Rhizophagus clarus]